MRLNLLGLILLAIIWVYDSRAAVAENVSVPDLILEEDVDRPARTVRIELDPVSNAAFYEVEVTSALNIWTAPLDYVVPSTAPTARLRLQPGKYHIRTRSLDENKNPGVWGAPQSFVVEFRTILNAFPKPNELITAKSTSQEYLTFEWPHNDEAKFYFFRLKDSTGQIIKMAVTKQTWLNVPLSVGAKYSWSVFPLQKIDQYKDFVGPEFEAKFTMFHIVNESEAGKEVVITVQKQKDVLKYQYEVVSVNATENSMASIIDSLDYALPLKMTPGEYEVRARSEHTDGSFTEWSAPSRVFIKRFVPAPESPTAEQKFESTNDKSNKVDLTWKKDAQAAYYKVFIFDSNSKLVLQEKVKDNHLTVELPDDQTYHWAVRAYSEREPLTDAVTSTDAQWSFSINKYLPLLLSSVEEPSQYYAWTKFIMTSEDYLGNNYEQNAIIKQRLLGGEGELGIGYWWRKSNFGILAQTALGGFFLSDNTYTYGDGGIFGGYRLALVNGDRLRFWAGLEIRQLPEIETNPFINTVNYNKIVGFGPQIQFQYLHSFSDKFGMKISGAIYQSQFQISTPNGQPEMPVASYRGSLMASYRYSPTTSFLMGYTYRQENAAYGSSDTPGATDTISLSGNYLSFEINFALEPKQK